MSVYEYDIFISYRHKDNKYDGWVTEFVTNLSKELEATFKEDISIYFDSNPHDGLLETHNVDKSLEGKLKCLILIPIISQTYCDQSSFAWQHEFCVFNKLAKEDQFGRDVKLSNGNVASRILPIKIHDLDAEDKTLLEKELGGVLRSVDFIYREAGVNRPLKPEDKKEDNLNKTGYRNQVNKVANAIKELIVGIQHANDTKNEQSIQNKTIAKPRIKMFSWVAVIILLLGLVGFGLYYLGGIGNRITPTIDRSIAVIPFVNMSDDPSQEYFSDGMTDEVLNHLFKIGDLRVISRTSSMKFKGAKLTTKEIAGQLGVTNILEGSVQKAGNRLKITVQLIDANTDNHLWSESYEREFNDVFAIQSEIAEAVARELRAKFSESAKRSFREIPTQSQLAYEYYLKGIQIFADLPENAISLYTKALLEDSLFAEARYARIDAHLWMFWTKGAEKEKLDEYVSLANSDIRFLKERFPESPQYKRALAKYNYWVNRKYDEALTLYHEVLKENPGDLEASHYVATITKRQGRWKEAIEGFEQCLKSDPLNNSILWELSLIYNPTHQPEKVLDVLKFGISVSPKERFLRYGLMTTLINMGYDASKSLQESGITGDEWAYYVGTDWINIGSISTFDKLRTEGKLLSTNQNVYKPITFDYAQAYYLKRSPSMTKVYADSAIAFLLKKQSRMIDDYRFFASLGKCYALAGNEILAIQNGKKAIELLPITLDAIQGTHYEQNLAEIYIMLNKYDLAMDKIEMLLSIPSNLSIGWMMADPLYEPIRNLPRFKKSAEKYKYVGKG